MKIKMLVDIQGTFLGDPNGCYRGQVCDVSEDMAARLIKNGHAQANWRDEPGRAYVPEWCRETTRRAGLK